MSSLHKATGTDCANSGPRQDQVETNAPIVGDDPAHIKLRAELSTRVTLGGYQLHELSCGGFIVARHDFSQFAPDLRSVQCLAKRLVEGNA